VQLLVKNLGKGMPENVVRQELESLDIHVHAASFEVSRPGPY
jgi:hypothetical protein